LVEKFIVPIDKSVGEGSTTAGEMFFPWEGFMLAVPRNRVSAIGHGGGNILSQRRFYACRAPTSWRLLVDVAVPVTAEKFILDFA